MLVASSCSLPPPALLQNSHSAQPPTMGRKKIQISRILDQRNRQVSSQVALPLEGEWLSQQGRSRVRGQMIPKRRPSPEATLGSLSVTESVGSASGGPVFLAEGNWTRVELQMQRGFQAQVDTEAEKSLFAVRTLL